MKLPEKIFKVSLELCPGKQKKNSLLDNWDGIIQLKEEYNAEHSNKIVLLRPRLNRLNLLYGIFSERSRFNFKMLHPFTEAVTAELYPSRKKNGNHAFELKASQEVSPGEVGMLLNDLRYREPDYFAFSDYCLFFPTGSTDRDGDREDERRSERERDRDADDSDRELEDLTLDEALAKLDSLVGLEPFKSEIKKIVELKQGSPLGGDGENVQVPFSCVYFLTIEKGMGTTTALKLAANIFYHLGIVSSKKMSELEAMHFRYFSTRDKISSPRYGLVGIHDVLSVKNDEPEDFEMLLNTLKKNKLKKIFFFIFSPDQEEERDQFEKTFPQYLPVRTLEIPPLSEEELLGIARRRLEAYNFELEQSAEMKLKEFIANEKALGTFENINTIEQITFKGVMNSLLTGDNTQPAPLQEKQLLPLNASMLPAGEPAAKMVSLQESEGLQQIEGLVGLESVKNKIREIIRQILLQKKKQEMGFQEEKLCYHMLFTGNPGTGKTTVARLIGLIFKELGLLSGGKFQEASRENMVARYVGHTALKTSALIRENIGNVLFIDEAYSLNDGSHTSFGQEALDTLVRHMENNRDRMVIILAGYTDEMLKLMERNPGLKDRIPHRIDFPDYGEEELQKIFRVMLREEYQLCEAAAEKLVVLFKSAHRNRDRHFGNGRFVRNILDRIKMKQAKRLDPENLDRETVSMITLEDILALYEDEDIARLLNNDGRDDRMIGF